MIAVTPCSAGASTVAAGPIGFVGLVVPLVVHRLTGSGLRWVLPYSLLDLLLLLFSTEIRPAPEAGGSAPDAARPVWLVWTSRLPDSPAYGPGEGRRPAARGAPAAGQPARRLLPGASARRDACPVLRHGGRLAVHFADQERLARAAEAAAPPNVTMTRMALVAARC